MQFFNRNIFLHWKAGKISYRWYKIQKVFNFVSVRTEFYPTIYMHLDINSLSRSNEEKFQITFRCNSSTNLTNFGNLTWSLNWYKVGNDNVNNYLTKFLYKLNELYCVCFPVQTNFVSKNHYNKPRSTPEINRLLVFKSKYFKLLKFSIVTRAENNRYKNRIKSLINKSETS